MNGWIKGLLLACLVLPGVNLAATISSASPILDNNPPSTAQLEIRANQAFNRGEYNTALPILTKLATTFKDQPSRLGPIKEKIRVCKKALASLKANAAATQPSALTDPTTGQARKPHPAPKPGMVTELTIKELGNFDYDQEHGGNIPSDVKRLNGTKIRLRGFMLPIDQAENITQFALVPSLFSCCFGQPPQIQHTIVVNCPRGKAVSYCPDEIVVEGAIKVEEMKDDGYVISIFNMDVSSVKPAPK
ncbi:MAG TPA: DUF3299 domain-containing protein [Tepidisphaeraceae bacterium]|nr:DUF3299 domain-containing protein [Tepidisphaeraceae bacterium]